MVDLKTQYQKIKNEIDLGIKDIIDSTAFVKGPVVNEFEKELAKHNGSKHVISCANGTDALQVAMMALGLKPCDEVITSNFTFVATVEVIALLGLTPVLVDVDPKTFNLCPEAVEKSITSKTRAIVPVHLFGQAAEMEKINTIAKNHNLFVIEDLAQAIGTEYIFENGSRKKTGTLGDIGCTSFFPSKNLGCFGDGGAIFTENDEIAVLLKSIVNHGMTKRYYHDHVGVNSRLDAIQAAILRVKLKNLDTYNTARQNAASFYDNAFESCSKLQNPSRYSKSTHTFHQYTLIAEDFNRDEIISFLSEKGIPAMVYYPVPLHLQKAYSNPRYKKGDFPITESLCKSVFSLPMHTELDNEQLDYITSNVLDFLK